MVGSWSVAAICRRRESRNFARKRLTTLRTAGRSVSPLANLNSFGAADSANRGLEGLPLASTYTVLIDPGVGENKNVQWKNLEDIKLKLTWAYQDVFPVGQCQ